MGRPGSALLAPATRRVISLALLGGTLHLGGCARPIGQPGDEMPLTGASKRLTPTHLLPGWRRDFSELRLESNKAVHLAAPAIDADRNRLCLGTPSGYIECMVASSGVTLWRKWIPPRKGAESEVKIQAPLRDLAAESDAEAEAEKARVKRSSSSSAIMDNGQLIIGTDDGLLLCLDSKTGDEIWRYEVPGALIKRPVLVKNRILFVDGTNTLYALNRDTGAWEWQVDRPPPAEFALSSEGMPASDGERAYVGFSDGHLMALSLNDGAQLWKRDLAPEHDKFEDVDATPVISNGVLYAASAASALYALDPVTGEVKWTQPIEGIIGMTGHEGDLIASTDRGQLLRLSGQDGHVRWRVRFPGGAPNEAVEVGPYLAVTMAEMGLRFVDPKSGQPIQHFNPGQGISAPPTVGEDGNLYVLGDDAVLYSFIHQKVPQPPRSSRSDAPFNHFGLDD